MKNFVISLANAQERRKHIVSEFGKHQVAFNFFDAITPDRINQIAEDLLLDIKTTDLRPGEIACLLSHVVLWKTVVDQNLDFIGIFEDDIYLGEQAAKVLSRTEWIPEDGHIIKVEAFYPKVTTSIKLKQIKCINRKLMPLKSKHMGTGGYILSNQGAKELLAFIQSYEKLIPIDHIMFKDYLLQGKYHVYQMSPAVCIQDFILMRDKTNFPSYLSHDRKLRKGDSIRVNHKLMFKDKITREFVRLSAQLIRFVKAETIVKIKFK